MVLFPRGGGAPSYQLPVPLGRDGLGRGWIGRKSEHLKFERVGRGSRKLCLGGNMGGSYGWAVIHEWPE